MVLCFDRVGEMDKWLLSLCYRHESTFRLSLITTKVEILDGECGETVRAHQRCCETPALAAPDENPIVCIYSNAVTMTMVLSHTVHLLVSRAVK